MYTYTMWTKGFFIYTLKNHWFCRSLRLMLAIYSDAVFISIPTATGAIVFAMGLRIKVTKDLCALESKSGTESVCFLGLSLNYCSE